MCNIAQVGIGQNLLQRVEAVDIEGVMSISAHSSFDR